MIGSRNSVPINRKACVLPDEATCQSVERYGTIIGHRLIAMPTNDIRNSAMAIRNGVNSCRRRKASHSPNASSAVMIGTGDRNAILGQLNQRRAMSGYASGVQILTPAIAARTALSKMLPARLAQH